MIPLSLRPRCASPLAVACLLLAGAAHAAPARLRTFCGERQGTAGDAVLVDRAGRTTLVLAQQGGDHSLLDQADDRVGRDPSGETGAQVGQRYCLVARLDAHGRPQEIVRGRRAAPAPRPERHASATSRSPAVSPRSASIRPRVTR